MARLFDSAYFIGKGGNFAYDIPMRSFYIINGGWLYFFEFNRDTLNYFIGTDRLKKYKNIVISISNLSDCCVSGLHSFLDYVNDRSDMTCYIITQTPAVLDYMKLCNIDTSRITIVTELVGIASLDIVSTEMEYGDTTSSGFLISSVEEDSVTDSIFYTGDCTSIPDAIMSMFVQGHIKGLFTDVSLEEPAKEHIPFTFFKSLVDVYGYDILSRIKFVRYSSLYDMNTVENTVVNMIRNGIYYKSTVSKHTSIINKK